MTSGNFSDDNFMGGSQTDKKCLKLRLKNQIQGLTAIAVEVGETGLRIASGLRTAHK